MAAGRGVKGSTPKSKNSKANPGFYPVQFEYKAGFGHGGLPDRDKIKDMYQNIRQPKPASLTWDLTDGFLKDHFWIHVDNPVRGMVVEAKIEGNRITLVTKNDPIVTLMLDPSQVDVSKPVELVLNGVSQNESSRLYFPPIASPWRLVAIRRFVDPLR